MANFVFVYYKETKEDDNAPDSMEKVMAAWQEWYGTLGDKLVDGGAPFNDNGQLVQKDSVTAIGSSASVGYTIVKAASIEEAAELSKGCPMLEHNSTASVRVYEALPM